MENLTTVEFDTWWALKEEQIPAHHRKEIVWADFKARGLSKSETMKDYDRALEKYGVRLS
jgi:predicted KAP-like P-loop ATPase